MYNNRFSNKAEAALSLAAQMAAALGQGYVGTCLLYTSVQQI